MFENFMFAINAIVPIILLIVLGYFLKRKNIFKEDFFRTANKFVFKIALPLLLFCNVYKIKDISSIKYDVVIYSCIVIGIFFLLGLLTVIFIPDKKKKRSSITMYF